MISQFLLSPAYAQQLGGNQGPDISFWRILIAFVVSLGLGLLVLLILRARNRGNRNLDFGALLKVKSGEGASDIRVLDSCRIGPQSEIFKIRSGNMEYLVLVAPSHSTLLDSYPAVTEPDTVEVEA